MIGGSKVRPRVDDIFKRDEKMGIYLKVYNFGADENTHKPEGRVEYELVKKRQQREDLRFYRRRIARFRTLLRAR